MNEQTTPDGLLRMSLATLMAMQFVHVISGLDDDDRRTMRDHMTDERTTITGYTEWASTTKPPASLGWDWELVHLENGPTCVRLGPPRTNLLLMHSADIPYDWDENVEAIAEVIDGLPWGAVTNAEVLRRYS
ncbi:DUF4902 domain-containing protein [Bordetella petrii]|uniref:DUF4902 domain-containing protein n=1 Tax=Bordetella petrii TaxID=94624 RepID=UPI0009DCECE8